jgi:hypothetical protein
MLALESGSVGGEKQWPQAALTSHGLLCHARSTASRRPLRTRQEVWRAPTPWARRTLEIMPRSWLMENLATSLLTKPVVLASLPYLDITHCQHRARYMKATQPELHAEALQGPTARGLVRQAPGAHAAVHP